MPYATSIERLAEARGEARGEARAKFRGGLRLMIQVLTKKLGKLPPQVTRRLEQSTFETLELLCDSLGDIQSLPKLKAWVAEHVPPRS